MLVLNDMRADARVDREAAALAAAGHDVTVLALRSSEALETEERDGFTIRRVADYTNASWKRPWLKVAQGHARTRALTAATLEAAPDVVHAHDSDTLVAAGVAANAGGARLVYDAHELYPDMLQEHGLSGTWPVQHYWRAVERKWVPKADAVITVSEGLADALASRYGTRPVVVANMPALAKPGDADRLRRELGIDPGTQVALYQGVLVPGRGLERLVRAWTRVPQAVLVVQGFGAAEDSMRQAALTCGLGDRVRFMGRVPARDLHDYASGADLGIVIYERTTLNNYLAAPNKLYAYLMAGLPVASSDFPGLASVVEGERVGATFDPADEASIAATIVRLLDDRGELVRMGERARLLAERRCNWDVEKEKLVSVYERLAARPGTPDA